MGTSAILTSQHQERLENAALGSSLTWTGQVLIFGDSKFRRRENFSHDNAVLVNVGQRPAPKTRRLIPSPLRTVHRVVLLVADDLTIEVPKYQ